MHFKSGLRNKNGGSSGISTRDFSQEVCFGTCGHGFACNISSFKGHWIKRVSWFSLLIKPSMRCWDTQSVIKHPLSSFRIYIPSVIPDSLWESGLSVGPWEAERGASVCVCVSIVRDIRGSRLWWSWEPSVLCVRQSWCSRVSEHWTTIQPQFAPCWLTQCRPPAFTSTLTPSAVPSLSQLTTKAKYSLQSYLRVYYIASDLGLIYYAE